MDATDARICRCLAARRRARGRMWFIEEGIWSQGVQTTRFSILTVLSNRGPKRMNVPEEDHRKLKAAYPAWTGEQAQSDELGVNAVMDPVDTIEGNER